MFQVLQTVIKYIIKHALHIVKDVEVTHHALPCYHHDLAYCHMHMIVHGVLLGVVYNVRLPLLTRRVMPLLYIRSNS